MSQWFKNYINVSYYNKNVLISVGWCTQKHQLAIHHPRKTRFVADCAVNHTILKFFDARNIGGTGYFQNTGSLEQKASRRGSTRLGKPLKEINMKVSTRTKR
jgi:hypothetical protein